LNAQRASFLAMEINEAKSELGDLAQEQHGQ